MKLSTSKKQPGGYISILTVLVISIFMLLLMVFAYNRALDVHAIQADIQLSEDYQEKEEATLRAIVSLLPNRAIQAMRADFNTSDAVRDPIKFESIFRDALTVSNSEQSISPALLATMNLGTTFSGNTGDTIVADVDRVFGDAGDTVFVTPGVEVDLGVRYPPSLDLDGAAIPNDEIYPLITSRAVYGTRFDNYPDPDAIHLSSNPYSEYNRIRYPNINFGYSTPGSPFLAKRNWWAFKMDLAGQDSGVTGLSGRPARNYVLSLYEIPSQLPISSNSFVAIGQHADGSAWTNTTISGNVFAGKAQVEGNTDLDGLASRRSIELSGGTTIGGQNLGLDPMAPGVREDYRLTQNADFFPVSKASDSGKAAFVPIDRGIKYFDRFSVVQDETNALSPTTWSNYSIGAMECAMQLDVTAKNAGGQPIQIRFRYFDSGVRREIVKNKGQEWALPNQPPLGYSDVADENQTVTFDTPHNLVYGLNGSYAYLNNVTGTITFDNDTFGDPLMGTRKRGYARAVSDGDSELSPFNFQELPNTTDCIAVLPESIPQFLGLLGADSTDINSSLAVNVDYVTNNSLDQTDIDNWGVILASCADLRGFTKGFSIVTNMTLYIGDDFNVFETTSPSGYVPPSGKFYPPCSIFTPEKRFGVEFDPYSVEISGQVGSVYEDDDTTTANQPDAVRLLDAKAVSGGTMSNANTRVNLSTLSHPDELPPIIMKNWLVVIEEVQ